MGHYRALHRPGRFGVSVERGPRGRVGSGAAQWTSAWRLKPCSLAHKHPGLPMLTVALGKLLRRRVAASIARALIMASGRQVFAWTASPPFWIGSD